MQRVVGLLAIWKKNWGETVERTSKDGSKEFNGIGKVNANSTASMLLYILAYDVDLLGDFVYLRLDLPLITIVKTHQDYVQ